MARGWRLALAAAALAAGTAAHAQTYETPSDPDEGPYPLLLDGTLSGAGDLKEDNAPHSGRFRFPTLLEPWDGFKANVQERTGITFGGSWGVLWQNYSDLSPFLGGTEHDSVNTTKSAALLTSCSLPGGNVAISNLSHGDFVIIEATVPASDKPCP
jgi:hypothetical protein